LGKRIFTGLQPRRLGRLIAGLAGSWTAAGEARLAAEARRFTLVRSELMEGINRILRYVTWAIVPVAALMLISQLHVHNSAREALTATVAALVGMVPQGLVLLTSVAFGVLRPERGALCLIGELRGKISDCLAQSGDLGCTDGDRVGRWRCTQRSVLRHPPVLGGDLPATCGWGDGTTTAGRAGVLRWGRVGSRMIRHRTRYGKGQHPREDALYLRMLRP